MRLGEVAVEGATIAVRQWGEPGGTSFLFWHSIGPGGSGAMLGVAAEPLAAAGMHVVAVDPPGFGLSPAPTGRDYSLNSLSRLLWGVADELGLDRPVVSGHSWGGAVAVAAAGAQPGRVRALVLYDSGHVDYADWPGADLTSSREEVVAAARGADGIDTVEQLVVELRNAEIDQDWMMPAWREAVEDLGAGRIRLRVDPDARGESLFELTHGRPSAWWPAIAAAGIPTLLLLATEPAEVREANERLLPRFLETVPQVDVIRPGCRHQVFADLGPRSGQLVAGWLSEHAVVA